MLILAINEKQLNNFYFVRISRNRNTNYNYLAIRNNFKPEEIGILRSFKIQDFYSIFLL